MLGGSVQHFIHKAHGVTIGFRAKIMLGHVADDGTNLVRQTREKEGKNLADLARALKTSWAAAQKLETPANNPTLRQLERTAAVLGKRLVVSFD